MASTKRTRTGHEATDKALDELRTQVGKIVVPSQLLWWASNDLLTTDNERYFVPGWTSVTNQERGLIPLPRAGRLRRLTVYQENAGTGAADLIFTVRVNKKDTNIVVTFPNTSTGVFVSRMDLDVPVKAGDIVGVSVRKSAVIVASSNAVIATLELV